MNHINIHCGEIEFQEGSTKQMRELGSKYKVIIASTEANRIKFDISCYEQIPKPN